MHTHTRERATPDMERRRLPALAHRPPLPLHRRFVSLHHASCHTHTHIHTPHILSSLAAGGHTRALPHTASLVTPSLAHAGMHTAPPLATAAAVRHHHWTNTNEQYKTQCEEAPAVSIAYVAPASHCVAQHITQHTTPGCGYHQPGKSVLLWTSTKPVDFLFSLSS